jgi:hypothetical protein
VASNATASTSTNSSSPSPTTTKAGFRRSERARQSGAERKTTNVANIVGLPAIFRLVIWASTGIHPYRRDDKKYRLCASGSSAREIAKYGWTCSF